MTKGENVLCSPFGYLKGGFNMTKKEFEAWVSGMYNKFDGEKQLDYSLDYTKRICTVYATDTYESAVSKYDNSNGCVAIAMAYAKLKGIEIPTIDEVYTPWKAKNGERYYFVGTNGRVSSYSNDNDFTDDCCYEFGNYFKTREQAESALKKVKHLLKLQRLHDILCPDCDGEDFERYCVFYDTASREYVVGYWYCRQSDSDVYFTKEAAEKACEILNKEKEND